MSSSMDFTPSQPDSGYRNRQQIETILGEARCSVGNSSIQETEAGREELEDNLGDTMVRLQFNHG